MGGVERKKESLTGRKSSPDNGGCASRVCAVSPFPRLCCKGMGVHPRTPLLPWQGSLRGEGAEKQLSCATACQDFFFFFFLQRDKWEERRGRPRAGLHLAGTVGWVRREGERRKEKGKQTKKPQKKTPNNTRYLQEGFPPSLPTCHHPGTVRNNNKSRSHRSCPGSPPLPQGSQAAAPRPRSLPPPVPAALQPASISPGKEVFDGQGCSSDTIDFYFLSIKVVLEEMEQGKRMMSRNSRL